MIKKILLTALVVGGIGYATRRRKYQINLSNIDYTGGALQYTVLLNGKFESSGRITSVSANNAAVTGDQEIFVKHSTYRGINHNPERKTEIEVFYKKELMAAKIIFWDKKQIQTIHKK